MRRIVLVVHNVRSAHNVGSMLRTADGLAVEKVYFSGYTPYPETPDDERPPPIRRRATQAIAKTALGAEKSLDWQHCPDIRERLAELAKNGFLVVALEQTPQASSLTAFRSEKNVVLVVGNEVNGLDKGVLEVVNTHLQIPMLGIKESFNVSVAAAIGLYHLRHIDKNAS